MKNEQRAKQKLLAKNVLIAKGYILVGHIRLIFLPNSSSSSPGYTLYNEIRQFPSNSKCL